MPVVAPRWCLPLILLALALGALRGALFLGHAPLLALANSYDQARYSGCFDLYPQRADFIRPDTNSPEAPLRWYAFRRNPVPLCYLSSELLPQAAVVAAFHADRALSGATHLDVRWMGALRLGLLLAMTAGFCRAWWRRGEPAAALANALALPLVLLDPANTLYCSTFYAEATALFALYALVNLVLLWHDAAPSRTRRALLALAALALATSKMQHLALPLALALAVLVHARLTASRWSWQGLALLAGAVLGLALQFAQLLRGDELMASIRSSNRANVVFTALLPHVADPAATATRLGLAPDCLTYVGKPAWQLPGLAETVCPGIAGVGRLAVARELLREPPALLRLAGSALAALRRWQAPGLGVVEGAVMGELPADVASLDRPLAASPLLRRLLFAGPLLGLPFAMRRRGRLAQFAVLVATLLPATLAVIVLGDGLADVPKQGHLIFNACLAWWLLLPAALAARVARGQSAALSAPAL